MFAISFLQPLLLWGTALASVPLIIHILNKRRYRTVKWAAMEFLLRAFKENRRRIRLEQLLLLLLRMALVVILAMLLSRPQVSADDFGGLARRVVHHLLILDDSGSMGETSGIGSSFRVACQEVLKVSEALSKRRSGDLLTILRSSREKPDLLGRPVSSMLSSEVREVLRSARPGPDRLRLELCLERAKKIAEDVRQSAEVSSLHVYLLSDLKRVDLTGDQGRIADEILAKLRAFDAERSRFRVIRCGRSSPQNLALVALERKQPMSIAGQASTFEITVENQGTQSSFEVELGFTIDGGSRMTRRVPPLGPGEEHRQSFQADFQAAGSHWVEADLPKDRLDLDNRRSLAFPVAESSQILLIDGDPGESEELAETFYARTW
ncbi:MAG: BatA domain-containing protein [Planctomycetota bacterium]